MEEEEEERRNVRRGGGEVYLESQICGTQTVEEEKGREREGRRSFGQRNFDILARWKHSVRRSKGGGKR